MDTTTIVTTALSTGLATAILNQGIGWWRDSRKDNVVTEREARYLAVRLAVLLEGFALDCADAIADKELHDSSEGHAGRRHGTIPELAAYPDGDWRALTPNLMGRCLSLRNELKLSDGHIAFWEDIGERDSIPQEAVQQTGKCGYRAWLLATDLRKEYHLGTFDPLSVSAWDVVATLRTNYDQAMNEISRRRT
jgi:hypothetical protein